MKFKIIGLCALIFASSSTFAGAAEEQPGCTADQVEAALAITEAFILRGANDPALLELRADALNLKAELERTHLIGKTGQ